MPRARRAILLPLVIALGCARSSAPSTPAAPDTTSQVDIGIRDDAAIIAAIIAEGTTRSRALGDVRHLTDVIGPRLTGSEAMRRASEWMAARLRAHGADSVWMEPVPIARGWERRSFSLELVAPHHRRLYGASAGWAPGTDGPREGEVRFVDARSLADFRARFAGRLRGAWALTRAPLPRFDIFRPSATDSARVRTERAALLAGTPDSLESEYLAVRDSLLAAAGIAGTITSSDKDRGLLTMFGSPVAGRDVPAVIVSHETFAELHRLVAAGATPRLRADIRNAFTEPVPSHNLLADLRGTTLPDEVVLLGAHLDSWDLGTGATDNAAGAVAVAEALRILAAAARRPERTVRVVLFTGEEQGLLGAAAYVESHRRELPRLQAVLVVDNGSGRIRGLTLQGRDDLRAAWERLFRPLEPVGPFTVESRLRTGSDHLPFLRAGVPAYLMNQEWRSYDWTWHTQVDTFDHVVAGELEQMATVLAGLAWGLARAERLIPR